MGFHSVLPRVVPGGGGRCSSSAEVAPTVHYLETPSTRSNALLDITGEAGDD